MAKDFDYYFAQLRKKEEHRSKTAEVELRRMYKRTLKDLKQFVADEYYELAQDGKLTFEILRSKGMDARLLEEVESRLNGLTPSLMQQIRSTVEETYEMAYKGMVDAVAKSSTQEELKQNLQGLHAVPPETIKRAVDNPVSGLTLSDTLEKNRKNIIWDIKREIGVGLSNGDRYDTMARRIAKSLDGDYKKAVRIARTETHRVKEAGHLDSAKSINDVLEQGVTDERLVKVWKTMKDGVVRPQKRYKTKKGWKSAPIKLGAPDHVKMDGAVVAMNESFDLGGGVTAMAPGQSGVAGHDINCRCFVKYVLMNDEEFEKATGKQRQGSKKAQAAKYEQQETALLDEKNGLLAESTGYKSDMADLEAGEYKNIWKNPVTVKDYDTLKDKVPAKRQYFEEQFAKDGSSKWTSLLDDLDDFEKKGQDYLKFKNKLEANAARLKVLDDDIKDVRLKLMKANGIDPDKIKAEIADLKIQLADASVSPLSKIKVDINGYGEISAEDYLKDPKAKKALEDKNQWAHKLKQEKEDYGLPIPSAVKKQIADYEDFHAQLAEELAKGGKVSSVDTKKIADLQKKLKSKEDELEAVVKRYGLEDDKFSQARKDAAYWFTNKNGGAKAADGVLRDTSGEVWRGATQRERDYIHEYTRSYHKYNEPLRGIEYGTNKFLGVGKVDMDQIGVSYSGYRVGQIKAEIDDITSIIEKSSYDFDIWLNRGCGFSGMDKFFGIDPSDFYLPEDELAAKLVGTTPIEHGFMSTGVAKGTGFSGDIKLNIYAPSGTKMMYVEPFSAFGNGAGKHWDGLSTQSSIGYEAEVLVQRDTTFRVLKVEKSNGTVFVDMEVIDQKAH